LLHASTTSNSVEENSNLNSLTDEEDAKWNQQHQQLVTMSTTNYEEIQENAAPDRYGAPEEVAEPDGLMRETPSNDSGETMGSDDESEDEEEIDMSIEELIYSSTSYYAIAKPVALTMILSALAVVIINDDSTRQSGQAAMTSAYTVFSVDEGHESNGQNLAYSLANALIMVSVICCMTFVIVILYRLKCMKFLIGYMIMCSGTLLGILGGNMFQTLVYIYYIPVDIFTFYLFVFNFCIVGVLAVFWGGGIPKYVTQGYLIATSVILAWHLSFFDDWTTWSLLFMLAIYDLCAVLTPCGPLKFLVDAMSQEDSPDMPGLLFEADLPPEAKRPSIPKTPTGNSSSSSSRRGRSSSPTRASSVNGPSPRVRVPLAIAKVYQLAVLSVPNTSMPILFPQRFSDGNGSSSPLLVDDDSGIILPENPSAQQLQAMVVVQLPASGGRLEHVKRRGKKVYLERDRYGNPKRILWVDRTGKVFAEMKEDDEEGPERNSIRLGLGDFIFYSVLVAKAAQYSFATFAACMLVILAGLGGTLVLLSVYHHALPALPISIFLGVVFYFLTRIFIEPWVEAVLNKPYYV
jgi:presenilin 1